MTGAYGGRVARPVLGVVPAPVPGPALSPVTRPRPSPGPSPGRSSGPSPSPGPGPVGAAAGASISGRGAASASVTVPVSGGAGRWRERVVPALRERLPVWLQLRCGLEPKTLAALAVVLVAAGVFAAVHFWTARPHSVRAPDPVEEAAHARTSPPMPDGAGEPEPEPSPGPPPGAGPGGHVVVDVSGKVRRPGIRQLPSGARVADALRAAGGVRDGADLTGLNRARVLMDGEQIVVGAPPGPSTAGGAAGVATGSGSGGAAAGPVSLNTATVEQLDTLPGVGPVLAQHIVDYRTQHGGFRSIDELREVNGIGDRRFADLQPLVGP